MTESVNPIEIAWNMENHRPFLMAVYKKACKLNIRFCRSDLNFLPLLKLLLPGHVTTARMSVEICWNPLYFEKEGRTLQLTLQPGLSARRMLQTFRKDVKKKDGAFISKKRRSAIPNITPRGYCACPVVVVHMM